MSYQSIDSLQNTLKDAVFQHTKDAKKAAGRALGTIVELITYYLLREWGLCDYISIERGLPEFGDGDIRHNVEFTLHPVLKKTCISQVSPLTSANIMKFMEKDVIDVFPKKKSNKLLDAHNILRNSCLLAENDDLLLIANLCKSDNHVHVALQKNMPFAMVECKRVGVEAGCKKGPQTIEKAKQGAYVAQMTSALQKIWVDGKRYGLIYKEGSPTIKPYEQLLNETILQQEPLRKFILSIGVVSNHGNWFTSNNKNKEMKVLANAYDWLLFLTDAGLAEFVTTLLLKPEPKYRVIRDAFIDSYEEGKKMNVFTKTRIDKKAHDALCEYFSKNIQSIEGWFNVITPKEHEISGLREALNILKDKNWR